MTGSLRPACRASAGGGGRPGVTTRVGRCVRPAEDGHDQSGVTFQWLLRGEVGLPHVNESITLEIPAKAEYVVLGRLALAGLLRERGFTADAVADLKLALTEACSNSIRHAYNGKAPRRRAGRSRSRSSMLQDRLVMKIRDDGAGFHEDDVDCPQCAAVEGAAHLSEGGMGISIIRAVVDEFELQRPAEGGTVLVLTKLCDAWSSRPFLLAPSDLSPFLADASAAVLSRYVAVLSGYTGANVTGAHGSQAAARAGR